MANHLRRQLRLLYAEGGRLPSENEMAAELGVSRGTIRQALSILQQEGFISRHQGLGTFANPKVLGIPARIDFAYEFAELIKVSGYEATIRTLEVKTTTASAEAASRLGLAAEAPVVLLRKVFCASGQPAIYVHEEVPVALLPAGFQPEDLAGSLFYFLERQCQIELSYVLSEIMPSVAEGEGAEILEVAPGSPQLKFVEVFFDAKNQPLVLATILFRESLIRFHALRKIVPLE
ncbi:MAG: GntR family transcriptional regulator [Anaerolineales bacterium]